MEENGDISGDHMLGGDILLVRNPLSQSIVYAKLVDITPDRFSPISPSSSFIPLLYISSQPSLLSLSPSPLSFSSFSLYLL